MEVWMVYVINVIDIIQKLFICSSVLLGLAVIFFTMMYFVCCEVADNKTNDEDVITSKEYLTKVAILFCISLILMIVIPTKDTLYTMIGINIVL